MPAAVAFWCLPENDLHIVQAVTGDNQAGPRHRWAGAPHSWFSEGERDKVIAGKLRVDRHIKHAALVAGINFWHAG